MKKLNLVFQEVLKFLLIFLVCFVWARYFIRALWLAVVVSIGISALAFAIFGFIARKRRNKTSLKLKEKEDAENMFLSLCFDDKPMDFFAELASKKHKNITKHKDHIVITHSEENVKTVLFADLSFQPLDTSRLLTIHNKMKKEKAIKIVICCKEIKDKNVELFCENFPEKIVILDTYETYKQLFKTYDCFPRITKTYPTTKKVVFKDFVAHALNKNRTKGYLFSALILILSGLFIRANIYYCIIASLLVVCAIISQFNPYFNRKTKEEVL